MDSDGHHARRRKQHPIKMRVSRPVYTEQEFQRGYEQLDLDQSASARLRKIVSRQRCTLQSVKRSVIARFPIVTWLPAYDVRENLISDVLSGFTVGTMRIPQAMAYAMLANLPPVYGLYVAFFGVLCYTIMGTSRHISMGTFAVVCIMTGNAIDRVLSDPSTVSSESTDDDDGPSQRVLIASALALTVGVIQLLMAVLHLGFVTIYLSEPLVRGFTTGAACHVFTSQFKHLFGVPVQRSTGLFSLIKSYIEFFSKLSQTNVATIIVSTITIAFIVAVSTLQDFWKHKGTHRVVDGQRQRVREPRKTKPIPSELIVIIVATVISYLANFAQEFGVTVVGDIPTGIPVPMVPQVTNLGLFISDAIAIAIVGFAVSISMAKIMAKKYMYEIDSNQELLAYGSCQIFGSFFNCFPMSASLSRSLVQEVSGGRTQLAGLLSSMVVLLVLIVIGPLFEQLPKCCLASIIVVALAGMFRQFKDLVLLWQVSTYDFLIWMVTFLCVVLLGVDIGLALGVGFSLITVVIRTQQPHSALVGCIPGTDIYRDIKYCEAAEQVPGIRIFRSQSCLCFVNAEYFKSSLYSVVFQKSKTCVKTGDDRSDRNGTVTGTMGQQPTEELTSSTDPSATELSCVLPPTFTSSASVTPSASPSLTEIPLHTIIIDCSMFSFIDTVGLKTLHSIVAHCATIDVRVIFACCKASARESILKYFEYCSDHTVGLDRMYLTVHDAMLQSQQSPVTPTNSTPDISYTAGSIQTITSPTNGKFAEAPDETSV